MGHFCQYLKPDPKQTEPARPSLPWVVHPVKTYFGLEWLVVRFVFVYDLGAQPAYRDTFMGRAASRSRGKIRWMWSFMFQPTIAANTTFNVSHLHTHTHRCHPAKVKPNLPSITPATLQPLNSLSPFKEEKTRAVPASAGPPAGCVWAPCCKSWPPGRGGASARGCGPLWPASAPPAAWLTSQGGVWEGQVKHASSFNQTALIWV